jgi:DNA-binding PadR family transcriptional regulator
VSNLVNQTIRNKGKPHREDDANNIVEVSPREELVLFALYGKELYGLQIPQAMEEASGGKRQMGIGTLYPVLHSLEKKGLVASRWGDERRQERGGARRRYYKLTGNGVATLEAIQAFHSKLLIWQPG